MRLNRAVARLPLFQKEADYEAFERVLRKAHERFPIEIMAYCVMPNHWHFVLRPTTDGQLTEFLRCLAHTHTMRWHAHYHTAGTGHSIRGGLRRFLSRTTLISTRLPVTSSGTRCVRGWSPRLRPGDGRVCGSTSLAAAMTGPCWRVGRCHGRGLGSNTSTRRRPKQNWKRCGGRSSGAAPSAIRIGNGRSPSASGWNGP